jgi:hypothetical protein
MTAYTVEILTDLEMRNLFLTFDIYITKSFS